MIAYLDLNKIDNRSVFPNAISRAPDFSQINTENFPSLAFGKILFPVLTQYRPFGTGFFPACLRLGNIQEFLNASQKKINNFSTSCFVNWVHVPQTIKPILANMLLLHWGGSGSVRF